MKKIKIYEDKQRVESIHSSIKIGVEKVQALVNAFNELGFNPVKESELAILMSDPLKLYKERTDSLEMPPNVNREKYLQIMNLPSPTKLKQAWEELKPHDLMRSPEFVKLVFDKVLVNDEEVETLTNRFAIFVDEGSTEHNAARQYLTFIEMLNSIASKKPQILSETSGRNEVLDIVHVQRVGFINYAVPTLDKLRNFIRL